MGCFGNILGSTQPTERIVDSRRDGFCLRKSFFFCVAESREAERRPFFPFDRGFNNIQEYMPCRESGTECLDFTSVQIHTLLGGKHNDGLYQPIRINCASMSLN